MENSRRAELDKPDLPSAPEAFGYKTAWYAVRCPDPLVVARELDLSEAKTVNWMYGVSRGYSSDDYLVFLTPDTEGWILAMGVPILYETESNALNRMVELSGTFGEAQFFASMRVSSAYCWGKAAKGKLIRWFYEGDGNREVIGNETPEEEAFGWQFFDSNSLDANEPGYWERKDLIYPDEEHVLQIAGKWSINPETLPNLSLAQFGLLGTPGESYPPKPATIPQNQPSLKKPGLFSRIFGR